MPTVGCSCDVCQSADPRDNRLRPSVIVEFDGQAVLIDTTPDFRQQALRAGIEKVDAVLFTHAHADHIMGLDDIRPFNFRRREPIPIYGSAETLGFVRNAFGYIFSDTPAESTVPKLRAETFAGGTAFPLLGLECLPVKVRHGKGTVYGFRMGKFAYLTDHNEIPDESLELLRDLDVLFLDALRHKPHPTHSTVERSLAYVEQLRPRLTYFTHISHDLPHRQTESVLPPYVRLAYDGLEVEVEL
ncbi:MAG: MBL fold metallo-hydrolase [Pirellulaceae bacterium]